MAIVPRHSAQQRGRVHTSELAGYHPDVCEFHKVQLPNGELQSARLPATSPAPSPPDHFWAATMPCLADALIIVTVISTAIMIPTLLSTCIEQTFWIPLDYPTTQPTCYVSPTQSVHHLSPHVPAFFLVKSCPPPPHPGYSLQHSTINNQQSTINNQQLTINNQQSRNNKHLSMRLPRRWSVARNHAQSKR
jgi:hypothetical protein